MLLLLLPLPQHPLARTAPTALPSAPRSYAAPLQPVSLRERHADGAFVAHEDAENGADVVSLEEDMALR